MVIQENYELFKTVVGSDFDPLSLVFELKDNDSEFWNKISTPKYSHLWGLLYGFGLENSYAYKWTWRHVNDPSISSQEKEFSKTISRKSGIRENYSWEKKNVFTISHFPIPSFVSIAEDDPVVTKFERESEKIQAAYKGKDFVAKTLELLTKD